MIASDALLAEESVALLTERLDGTLDRLQTALAKMGGADAPSQQFGDPAAGRALALIAAGVESPEIVRMETTALNDHLNRLFSICLLYTSPSPRDS